MRVLAWTLGYWKDAKHAQRDADNWRGYRAWYDRMQRCFKPVGCFVASGTWSAHEHSPIPEAVTVNAGIFSDRPYYGQRDHYGKAAFIAGMAYALNRNDWDLLVILDTDALMGALDIPKLFTEFLARPEVIIAPSWCHLMGGPFMVWKREGAIRLVHCRPYANIAQDGDPDMPTLWEYECAQIYKGRWWNPWPFDCLLQEGAHPDEEAILWPACGRPSTEAFAQRYIQNHLEKCVTLNEPNPPFPSQYVHQ